MTREEPVQVTLSAGVATDVGRVREHNEDHAVADGTLFLVADGMGGHAAGEVASELAAQTLAELAGRSDLTRHDVVRQLERANERILASAREHPEQTGMATTVTGLALVSTGGTDHWLVFNIGDSRTYRFADNTLSQVTVDHSEVRELLDAGRISEEEAARHPGRNVVTRSLGSDPMESPDTWVFPTEPGERFLLCSDGVSGELSREQMEHVIRLHESTQDAAEALVRAAVEAGGRDNATAIVVGLGRTVGTPVEGDTAPRIREVGSGT